MLTNSATCKNSNSLFGMMMALALFAAPAPIMAQETAAQSAPPQEALASTQDQEPEQDDTDTAVSSAAAEEGAIPAKADPCPLPATEMAQAPDDLAKIQSDIDRYTLCMERASLLQRLNDVALENQEKLKESNGVSKDNPGMNLGNLPDFEAQKRAVENIIDTPPALAAQEQAPPSNEWLIVKISGAASGLSVQLGKSDGTLTNAKAGDELPDGSTVNSVNATSVSITQEGEKKTLKWIDNSSQKGS